MHQVSQKLLSFFLKMLDLFYPCMWMQGQIPETHKLFILQGRVKKLATYRQDGGHWKTSQKRLSHSCITICSGRTSKMQIFISRFPFLTEAHIWLTGPFCVSPASLNVAHKRFEGAQTPSAVVCTSRALQFREPRSSRNACCAFFIIHLEAEIALSHVAFWLFQWNNFTIMLVSNTATTVAPKVLSYLKTTKFSNFCKKARSCLEPEQEALQMKPESLGKKLFLRTFNTCSHQLRVDTAW